MTGQTPDGAPPSLLTTVTAAAVRHGLTAFGGVLVEAGFLDKDHATQLSGMAAGVTSIVVALIWSAIEKSNKLAWIKALLGQG